jgi:hypothetical protein
MFKFHPHHGLFRPLANGIEQLNALGNEVTEWRMMQGEKIAAKDLCSALLEAKDPKLLKDSPSRSSYQKLVYRELEEPTRQSLWRHRHSFIL